MLVCAFMANGKRISASVDFKMYRLIMLKLALYIFLCTCDIIFLL
jgi:hypothetical protein